MEIRDLIRGFLGFPSLNSRDECGRRGRDSFPSRSFDDEDENEQDCVSRLPTFSDPLGMHKFFESEINWITQGLFSGGQGDFSFENGHHTNDNSRWDESGQDESEEMDKFFERSGKKSSSVTPFQPNFSFDTPAGRFQGSFFGSSVVEERVTNSDGSMQIIRTERSSDGTEKRIVTKIDSPKGGLVARDENFPLGDFHVPFSDRDIFKRLFS
ncbi:unnamed protein product [Lepeophtheirus salmonis]|uniref:(salmon louse) hypothetical protein n=1 Tax=Lepeophtheirus salmonis TaxID=72036 RepID=A0A7R8H728_LEPSM|nr:unnamed protein product [Lepeophtheirus salmonis]CAF2910364.1 unnamed protein product [Lepeophtheirus salmonis]